ncbi:MAG: adenylyltransferase/cytidyltransferase family protein [Candidatus Methylacidiphilales bacterium]|nr:adenylyltransferase/cytidyltransferase family protein [Candidatus Methylacidiphilales bacterium]
MNFPKCVAFNDLENWRQSSAASGSWVVTNGCFDLLHVGHVRYLQHARTLGQLLLVGINDDEGVRQLKGPNRPLNTASDRAEVLAGLACVDAVCIFPGSRATAFLAAARPDIYAKGGDYTLDTLDPEERKILEAAGSRIELLQLVPGRSTTSLVNRMRQP